MSEDKHNSSGVDRRKFLALAASSLSAGGMLTSCGTQDTHLAATEAQKRGRPTGKSRLLIVKAEEYDNDLFKLLKDRLDKMNLPDLRGKQVLIKPNMVDFVPGIPLITNPMVLKAAVDLASYLGAAKIVVGEGPAHNRDLEFLLSASGVGKMCHQLGVPFIDLNLDDLETVANVYPFTELSELYLPKSVVQADVVISLPKLKTHHYARITCSMKNLFGVVPGRKYGWPKNLLHCQGIDPCILDITRAVKPKIQLVDAITAMEGDGPLNGTAKQTNFLMLGTDPAAVDSTCARIMGLNTQYIPYIRVAGDVIGNIDPANIEQLGESEEAVATPFVMPISFKPDGQPATKNLKEASDAGPT